MPNSSHKSAASFNRYQQVDNDDHEQFVLQLRDSNDQGFPVQSNGSDHYPYSTKENYQAQPPLNNIGQYKEYEIPIEEQKGFREQAEFIEKQLSHNSFKSLSQPAKTSSLIVEENKESFSFRNPSYSQKPPLVQTSSQLKLNQENDLSLQNYLNKSQSRKSSPQTRNLLVDIQNQEIQQYQSQINQGNQLYNNNQNYPYQKTSVRNSTNHSTGQINILKTSQTSLNERSSRNVYLDSTQKQLHFEQQENFQKHLLKYQSMQISSIDNILDEKDSYLELMKAKTQLEEQIIDYQRKIERLESLNSEQRDKSQEYENIIKRLQYKTREVKGKMIELQNSTNQTEFIQSLQEQHLKEKESLISKIKSLEERIEEQKDDIVLLNLQIQRNSPIILNNTTTQNGPISQTHIQAVVDQNQDLYKSLINLQMQNELKDQELEKQEQFYQFQIQNQDTLLEFQANLEGQLQRDKLIFYLLVIMIIGIFFLNLFINSGRNTLNTEHPYVFYFQALLQYIRNFILLLFE